MSLSRHDFVRLTMSAAPLGLPGSLRAGSGLQPNPASAPSFLYFLSDDLGYGDIGCYGHPFNRTPRLDRLAAEGCRFYECPRRELPPLTVARGAPDRPAAKHRAERWIDFIKRARPASYELYDVRRDPSQVANLASREPERVRRMAAELDVAWRGIQAEAPVWAEWDRR